MPIITLETGWDGIRCPRCQCPRHTVVYVRHKHGTTRRVRICDLCQRRIVTVEKAIGVVRSTVETSRLDTAVPMRCT